MLEIRRAELFAEYPSLFEILVRVVTHLETYKVSFQIKGSVVGFGGCDNVLLCIGQMECCVMGKPWMNDRSADFGGMELMIAVCSVIPERCYNECGW